jgi:tetratricopeptide (TPR) repeat protein
MKAYQWVAAALLASATLVGAPAQEAQAQESTAEKTAQLNSQARERYQANDFAGAIALFEQAYKLEPLPNLLFNIAKCYEKMEDWAKAKEFYERFVVSPDVESEARQSSMTRIRELNEIIAAEEKLKGNGSGNGNGNGNGNGGGSGDGNGNGNKVVPPPAPDRTAGYVVMGAGGALVLGGVVMGVLANGKQGEFDDATTAAAKRDARDSGKNFALAADGLYGLGVIGLGVGLVLFLTADAEAPAEGQALSVPVNVWFGQGAAGVDMTWRF